MAWLEVLAQVLLGLERLHAQAAAEPPLTTRVGRAAGLLGVALYAGILATLALTGAGCFLLATYYSTPVALAIVGGVFAVIALIALFLEFRKPGPSRKVKPVPVPVQRPTPLGPPLLAQALLSAKAKANKVPMNVPTLAVGGLVAGLAATTALLASQPHVLVAAPKASLPKSR